MKKQAPGGRRAERPHRETEPPAMSPRALPVLCFCLLVLACTAVHQEDAPAGTRTPSGEETSRWSLVQSKVKELVQPLVTRTRERWQSFCQCSRSPNAMSARPLVAVFLALLLLGLEVRGIEEEEATSAPLLAQVQESLYSYWDTAKAAARSLYEKTYLPSMDEKLRSMYSQGSAAITTYAGIATDQLLTMLKGEH
ncbi:apolipoprotein C-II isoform X1 [Dasypus novemcinctus]|uniref:apolipoprotein C-II isoform X1 n=1 Tax=Dasypus novemcinctus TaxID=9361 RepID=UPI00265E53EB|nr:apolipoprotein C-II isoform X1 [Dasypus novemcinctus]